MNHDEKNFSPAPGTWSDPAVEARIVAWVAGEASAFETADLERILAANQEAAAFKLRIEAVNRLVRATAHSKQEPLRLSAERRAKLLAMLGSPAVQEQGSNAVIGFNSADANAVASPLLPTQRKKVWKSTWMMGLAASVALGVLVLTRIENPFSERIVYLAEPGGRDNLEIREQGKIEQLPAPEAPKENEQAASPARAALADASNRARSEVSTDSVSQFALTQPERSREEDATNSNLRASTFGGAAAASRSLSSSLAGPAPFESPVPGSVVLGYNGQPKRQATSNAPGSLLTSARDELNANQSTLLDPSAKPGVFNTVGVLRPPVYLSITKDQVAGEARNSRDEGGIILGVASKQESAQADQAQEPLQLSAFEVRSEKKSGVGGIFKKLWQGLVGSGDKTISQAGPKAENSSGPMELPLATSKQVSSASSPSHVQDAAASAGSTGQFQADPDLPVVRVAPALVADPLRAEVAAAVEPFSTFSLHVSDVSFRLAQAALARGQLPNPAVIRPEEFYNAFNYGDPMPTMGEKIGARIEQAAHPFLQQRNLVRIAMKIPATGRGAGQPLRLTVLLDTSGSMEREDRAASLRRALEVLVSLLGPNDRLTLIGFARQPRLLAEAVPGDQARQAIELVARIPSEGGTNLEAALKLGGELARRHQMPGAQNRIVMLTDGATNLGNAEPGELARSIETFRQQGIAFDACGVGLDGLDDGVLEALTRKGDGRYYVLDSPAAADAGFARQLAGAFRPAAENVKLQVRFNPTRVGHYRLIGFEAHRLRPEDFRNDTVDAAELAAEEAAVALYQVEVLPQGSGDVGEVQVRFRDAATGGMIERSWPISFDSSAPAFDRATPSLQLAGSAALLAEKLRGGGWADVIQLRELAPTMTALRAHYAQEPRVQELTVMWTQLRRLLGE